MTDLYDTLGVARDAPKEAVKAAFRSKAKTAHPDAGGAPEAFHAIEIAHRILSDDERRAEYDRTGKTDAEAARAGEGQGSGRASGNVRRQAAGRGGRAQ